MVNKENILSFAQEGLLALFISFAILFGGTELVYRSYAIQLFALVLSAVLLLGLSMKPADAFYYPSGIPLMIAFLVIIFFQGLPLSMGLIKFLSPKTEHFYQTFLSPDSLKHWHTLSVYSFATQRKLAELIALLSIYFFTLNTIKTKKQVQRFIVLCIGISVFLSFAAAVKGGFAPGREAPGLGIFSNRNYYAGFMLPMSFLCIGYGLSFQEIPKKIFFLFLAGMLSISIILSLSRAAIVSLFLWLCVMIVWFIQQKLFVKKTALMPILFVAILTAFLFAVNLGTLKEKIQTTTSISMSGRAARYRDALRIVKDFPILGVGLGNYGYIYTQYTSRPMISADFYVHSDPLQLLVESGAVGFIFYCLFFIFILKDMLIHLYKRHDPFVRCVLLAGLCGIFAVVSHSFFEVLFPVPAIAFMFWFMLALFHKAVYIHSNT